LAQFEWNDDVNYAGVIGLKKQNPNLKVLLSVGGWNLGSGPFSDMVTGPNNRAKFVNTTVTFLKKWNFDGLDLDWEYPGSRDGSRITDKSLFTSLISELKNAFKPFDFILTAAVGVGFSTADLAYEIDKISPLLDFINLMTYDLHGSWETFTGLNAPLYPRSNEVGEQRNLNIDAAVNYWITNGASKNKLVLGMASYGRSFTLVSSTQNGLGASANGPGKALPVS
jgi:chitinase